MNEDSGPWTGASGAEYVFYVFDRDAEIPSRRGIYIYAKKNQEGLWVPVYIGHGDLAARCTDPKLRECIDRKQASHVHLRLNSREDDCIAEVQDLLARYLNAFAPDGCHAEADRPPAPFATARPDAGPAAPS